MRYCKNNGGVINPENPKNVGFLKAGEEESKKGKKHGNSIIDRANYIKLSFHRHVLKFLLCEKRIYFDREYSPGYTKPIGFLEDLGFHLETSLPHIRSLGFVTRSCPTNVDRGAGTRDIPLRTFVWEAIWKMDCSSMNLSVRYVLQKATVKI